MLQIRTHRSDIPNHYHTQSMYGIVSRNTLFGFHRNFAPHTKRVDKDCTKSMLWTTTDETLADYMTLRLREDCLKGLRFHHLDNNNFLQKERVASLMPLTIETFSLDDLQKICVLHQFDLYIADTLIMSDDVHVMSGYAFTSDERSHRAMFEKYMRDMLYKNKGK